MLESQRIRKQQQKATSTQKHTWTSLVAQWIEYTCHAGHIPGLGISHMQQSD